jgi:hypothetical protein
MAGKRRRVSSANYSWELAIGDASALHQPC